MKTAVEINELMERIRRAANRENGLTGGSTREISATSDLPPVPEPLPLPPAPNGASVVAGGARPEALLDQAESFLKGGRKKNAVPDGVPKMLRPLYRNQGGVNGVVLEALERLIEVNRALRQQNYELHERMMALHQWAHEVTQTHAETRDWTLVADARLGAVTEKRLADLEERLSRLEKPESPRPADA